MTVKKIAILGAGMWGRTLGLLLSKNNLEIALWDIRTDLAEQLKVFYESMASAGHNVQKMPYFTNDLNAAINNAEIIFLVVPTDSVRDVSSQIRDLVSPECYLVIATKGIEERADSFSLLSEVVCEELNGNYSIGILSGPNLSIEIQDRHPAVTLVASENEILINLCMTLLASDIFRVYGSKDLRGVQIGGAVKNVIALAAGMVDQLGFKYNTKAALLTRGLVEITRLGEKMGGNPKTFTGISGLGDLICTASSPTSRNYRAGLMFGEGRKRNKIVQEIGEVVEGITNSKTVFHLSNSLDIRMPISRGVYRVVWEELDPETAIQELMTRKLKFE